MKERPILMTTESVKPILEGRKSQTRRVIKHPENYDNIRQCDFCCPYGQVGDRLWVRETFWLHKSLLLSTANTVAEGHPALYYNADMTEDEKRKGGWLRNWYTQYPSIFMPRWASRITLEITEIRVERLQEITEEDAIAEGIIETSHTLPGGKLTAYGEYMLLWDALNAKRGYPWESNPWVWVIEFAYGVKLK